MDEHVDPVRTRTAPDRQTTAPRPARRGRGGLIIGLLLIAAVAGGSYWWWTHRQAATAPSGGGQSRSAQGAPQPVGFATVDKGDIRIILNQLGTVSSLDTVTVYTQISGQLQEIAYKEGQSVKKGDFLAQIDPRPYQAALEQARKSPFLTDWPSL